MKIRAHLSERSVLKHCFILILLQISIFQLYGQQEQQLPSNWHLLDIEENGVYGISLEKVCRDLLTGKLADTIIVAIIDTGIDTLHPDLRNVLWVNPEDHGSDEDNNGYKGDRYGWNFLGSPGSGNLTKTASERNRIYYGLYSTYNKRNLNKIPKRQQEEYRLWKEAKRSFLSDSLELVKFYKDRFRDIQEGDLRVQKALNKTVYNYQDLRSLKGYADIAGTKLAKEFRQYEDDAHITNKQLLLKVKEHGERILKSTYQTYKDTYLDDKQKRKEIIQDDPTNFKDRYYGNANVTDIGGHGTHVAGIIGAERGNKIGTDGIINVVKLLIVKAIPAKGDEYDKDVATSIRYAVDQGAKVINMSFGKNYSPYAEEVKKALRYAKRKDVLIVRAAGNDFGISLDSITKYPSSKYRGGKKQFPHIITVGASGPTKDNLIGQFSNFGEKTVDVFAPGVDIYSTFPYNSYRKMSGTSMAAPVVTGLGALLRAYYPKLSAKKVKEIIVNSVTPIDGLVEKPGLEESREMVNMKTLCNSGGIVNAYRAFQMVAITSKNR